MRELKSSRAMWVKGGLFLIIGVVSAVLLWLEMPTLRTAVLLSLMTWGFCRAYYFAFYVISHYIDPGYRFAGLWDFAMYSLRKHDRR